MSTVDSRAYRCAVLMALIFLTNCASPAPAGKAIPTGKTISIATPLGLPAVPIPADNPPTAETVALGAELYFSRLLSVDDSISCATCHDPKKAFTDNAPVSTGVRGQQGKRNAPTVLNAAYAKLQFWDGRADTLEAQAAGPMTNPVEMGHSNEGAEKRLNENPEMKRLFDKAYGRGPVTMEKITKAIASFERFLVSGNSPFDRFMYGEQRDALSEPARRGLEVFRNPHKGNCVACHTIQDKQALFTDDKFHNLGVGMNAQGELTDLGRFNETKKEGDQGAFRTPTLRNIARTAPYMHDGSQKTLKDVVDFYVGGGNSNPYRDKEIKALEFLTKQERSDLVAFMESLNGEVILPGGREQ